MKKSLLYILAVLVGSLLFGACDKHDSASDPAPNSYSEFFINPPSFNTPSGSKVYWDDDGLWWSPSGDLVIINGNLYEITKVTDPNTGATQWKTVGGLQTDKVNDNFYCCYIGQSTQSPEWDEGNKIYHNVNLENIVPLVGESRDNLMTLKPCCAVFRLHFSEDLVSALQDKVEEMNLYLGRKIPKGTYDLDPVNALVSGFDVPENPDENCTEIYFSLSDIDELGYVYLIVPMDVNQFTSIVGVNDDQEEEDKIINMVTSAPHPINKGYVYCIEVQAVNK